MKKLVAIGGGENGRTTRDGVKRAYELREIDQEIIRLTEKKTPNFLFLGHAQNEISLENRYFDTMRNIYDGIFGCQCKTIKKASLLEMSKESIDNLIDWADIIYEGGGDTQGMIELWKETKFGATLRRAWESGKVLCGVSAGANCWFHSCSSDSLKMQLHDPTAPMINVECLNFFTAYFSPHYNVVRGHTNHEQQMKESLKTLDLTGLGLSNCAALEIIDDSYRLLTTDASNYNIQAFGVKTFYKDGQYFEEQIDRSDKFKPLKELLHH